MKNEAKIVDEAKERGCSDHPESERGSRASKKRAMDEGKTGNDHSCIHDGGKSCCSKYRCDRAGYAGRRNIERNG